MTPTELFELNMKLVPYTMKYYFAFLEYDEDYMQIGHIGLWRACNTHNETKAKFSTYAITCIHHEIIKTLRKKTMPTSSMSTPIDPEHNGSIRLLDAFVDPTDCYAEVEMEPDIDLTPFIATLTLKQKLTLQHLQQGIDYKRMCYIKGVSHQSVYQDIRVLKEKLKKYLGVKY